MTSRRDILKSAALLGVTAWPAIARSAPVAVAGTAIAGHFSHEAARIWVQATGAARGAIEFWPQATGEGGLRSMPIALAEERSRAAVALLDGLRPDTAYRYRVVLDGGSKSEAQGFRTAAAPGAAPRDFRLYFGSCAYTETHTRGGSPYGDELHIFDTLAAQMGVDRLPHLMLWLGDNLYLRNASRTGAAADFSSAELMEARYREVRAKPFLQKIFAATHHYAIWDDHDYGPDNGDRSFALRDESLRLFKAYWPNPDMGLPGAPNTSFRFAHEDVDFILLDSRSHRDPQKAPPDPAKSLYGKAQMAWLKDCLRESRAPFKVVAGGSQFLSRNANGVTSGWHSYEAERDPFLAWLAREKIPGVILLSGDRHNTQVFRLDVEGAPPIFEFSCSPLTSKLIAISAVERANPRGVPALAVERRNFGTLEFSRRGESRVATARCFDSGGGLLWTHELASTAVPARNPERSTS